MNRDRRAAAPSLRPWPQRSDRAGPPGRRAPASSRPAVSPRSLPPRSAAGRAAAVPAWPNRASAAIPTARPPEKPADAAREKRPRAGSRRGRSPSGRARSGPDSNPNRAEDPLLRRDRKDRVRAGRHAGSPRRILRHGVEARAAGQRPDLDPDPDEPGGGGRGPGLHGRGPLRQRRRRDVPDGAGGGVLAGGARRVRADRRPFRCRRRSTSAARSRSTGRRGRSPPDPRSGRRSASSRSAAGTAGRTRTVSPAWITVKPCLEQ